MKTLELNDLQVAELKEYVDSIVHRLKEPSYYFGAVPKEYMPKNPDECLDAILELNKELQRMLDKKEKHRLLVEAWHDIKKQLSDM